MKFLKEGFSSPTLDNDEQYILLVESMVNSVDNNAIGKIIKTPSSYIFRISTSDVVYVNSLISSINELNTFVKISLNWAKSCKKNGTLSFTIPIFV